VFHSLVQTASSFWLLLRLSIVHPALEAEVRAFRGSFSPSERPEDFECRIAKEDRAIEESGHLILIWRPNDTM
jgi:hypothetical protein